MTYLTGKLPSAHGVQDFLPTQDGDPGKRFLDGQTTCSELLAKSGYTTGVCGKWHMGDDRHPQAGFKYWRTTPGGGGPYKNPEFWVDGQKKKIEGFKTDITTDFALEFIEQNRSRPFSSLFRSTLPIRHSISSPNGIELVRRLEIPLLS